MFKIGLRWSDFGCVMLINKGWIPNARVKRRNNLSLLTSHALDRTMKINYPVKHGGIRNAKKYIF